jgi:hypothetical protein
MSLSWPKTPVLARLHLPQAANAARIFGLYPRKGAIAVGSDADIALWDPGHRRTIDGAYMQSRSGYSVYDGWQVQGWPRFVIRRGQVAFADGQITTRPGDGQWLPRDRTAGTLPCPSPSTPISAPAPPRSRATRRPSAVPAYRPSRSLADLGWTHAEAESVFLGPVSVTRARRPVGRAPAPALPG